MRTKHRKGSALVAVLVMLALAVALLWTIQAGVLQRSTYADIREGSQIEQALVIEGLRDAMHQLSNDEDLLVDHLAEPWNTPFEIIAPTPSTLRVLVQIEDANRFFDLNNAPVLATSTPSRPVSEVLHDLFRLCGMTTGTTDQVEALIDATDANNAGRFEEEPQPANVPLLTWSDLYRVPGFPAPLFQSAVPDPDRIRNFGEPEHPRQTFTLLPDAQANTEANGDDDTKETGLSGTEEASAEPKDRQRPTRVNINTAPAHVLRAIVGNTPQRASLVEQFLAYRQETPIREIGPYLGRLPPADVQIASTYLDTRSQHFWINIAAQARPSATPDPTARALVSRDAEGTVHIEQVQWLR